MASSLTVIGLGYVGLPPAQEDCKSGLEVVGFDTDQSVVSGLAAGVSHIDDIDSSDLTEMVGSGFVATTEPTCIRGSDVIVICVPTPLDADGSPDLSVVKAAARNISGHLQPGSLVVLESTTYPGTTEDTVRPLLEEGSGLTAGVDFNLA